MTTYQKLCVVTALLSALITAWFIESRSDQIQLPENQLYPAEDTIITQPQYYVLAQPRMMTLVWQPCIEHACLPEITNLNNTPEQNPDIGI